MDWNNLIIKAFSIFGSGLRWISIIQSCKTKQRTFTIKENIKYAEKFEKAFDSWHGFNNEDSNVLGLERHCSNSSLCTSFNNRGCSRHFIKSICARGEKTVEWCHIPWSNWQIFTSPFRHQRNCLIKKRYLKLDQGKFKKKSNYFYLIKFEILLSESSNESKLLWKYEKLASNPYFSRGHMYKWSSFNQIQNWSFSGIYDTAWVTFIFDCIKRSL